ncbi:MAG: tetratricopeptide repeat protein [Planctomycetota bacterium]
MAARVNTKFVVILTSSIVLVTGLIVGVVIYAKGTTAEQYAEQSRQREARYEQAMSQGDIEGASSALRSAALFAYRAYSKGQNPEELLRSIELLRKYQAKDGPDAQQHLGNIRRQAKDLADKYPDIPEYQSYHFDLLYDLTHLMGGRQLVAQLEADAQAALDVSPENRAAIRARGIARTRRLTDQMAVDQRQQAADDLERILAEDPEDVRAAFYLARWKINEANRLRRSNQRPELVSKLREDATSLTRSLAESEPNDPQRLYYHLETLRTAGQENSEELQTVAKRFAEAAMAEGVDRRLVVFAARFQPAVIGLVEYDSPEAQREARRAANRRQVDVLLTGLKYRPDDPLLRLHYGNALRSIGELDQAAAELDRARTPGDRDLVLDYFANNAARDDAIFAYADLLIQRALSSPKGAEREAYLAEAKDAALTLVNKQVNPRVTDSLLGRIDYAREQWMSAANRLTRASDAIDNRDLRLLALSAEALDRSGQPTAAIRRYEMAIELSRVVPGLNPLTTRLRLAGLLINQRDLEPAKLQLDLVLAQEPDNARAQLLLTRYHELSDRPEAALEVLDAKDDPTDVRAAITRASILRRMGRTEDALKAIRAAAAANPDNASLVVQELLLTPEEQADERLALAQRAKALGAESDRLELLVKQLGGETLSDDELATLMLRDQEDPVAKKVARARFFDRQGNTERSRAILAEAEAESPDHRSVILAAFDFALEDDQLDRARGYATRAARDNLDLVEGNAIQARLAERAGNLDEAITFLKRALEINSVDAGLWEQLGQLETRNGDLDGAEVAFETALRQNTRLVRSLLGLALIRQNKGQTAEALELIRRAYAIRPNNPAVRSNYFAFEGTQGDPERVIAERRRIAEANPEDLTNRRSLALLFSRLERFDEALQVAEGLLDAQDAGLADSAVLAQVRMNMGRNDLAEKVLVDHLTRRGPDATAQDHLAVARFYVQTNRPPEAVAAFERAVELEPAEDRTASLQLADYLAQTNRADRAVAIYRELLELDPQDGDLLAKLAAACVRLDLAEEAAGYVARMEPSPRRVLLTAQLSNLRGDRDAAIDGMTAALVQYPDNGQIRLLRAQTLAAVPERRAEAIGELETLIEAGDEVRPARRLRARLLALDISTKSQAIRELRSLLSQMPDDDNSRRLLISVLQREGSFGEAAVLASEVLETERATPEWYTAAGQLLALDGQPDRAIDRLQQSLNLAPSPQTLAAIFDVLIEQERFSEVIAAAEDHVLLMNGRPLLEAIKARALIATGQTEPGRNLFAVLLNGKLERRVESVVVRQFLRADSGDAAVAWLEDTLGASRGVDTATYRSLHHFDAGEFARVAEILKEVDRGGLSPDRRGRLDSLLAQALHADNRHAEAAAAYERALESQPDDFSSLNNLAVILAEELGESERALRYARRANELRPGVPEVVDTIGFSLLQLERYDEAEQKLEESRRLAVASKGRPLPLTLVHLAELHLARGAYRKAEIEANAAIKAARQVNDKPASERAEAVLRRLDSR